MVNVDGIKQIIPIVIIKQFKLFHNFIPQYCGS